MCVRCRKSERWLVLTLRLQTPAQLPKHLILRFRLFNFNSPLLIFDPVNFSEKLLVTVVLGLIFEILNDS